MTSFYKGCIMNFTCTSTVYEVHLRHPVSYIMECTNTNTTHACKLPLSSLESRHLLQRPADIFHEVKSMFLCGDWRSLKKALLIKKLKCMLPLSLPLQHYVSESNIWMSAHLGVFTIQLRDIRISTVNRSLGLSM